MDEEADKIRCIVSEPKGKPPINTLPPRVSQSFFVTLVFYLLAPYFLLLSPAHLFAM